MKRHIDAQDGFYANEGFYSRGLGRFVYHDHEPMGDIFSDIGNSISNAAQSALNTLEQRGTTIINQTPGAIATAEQSGLSKLWSTFFGTPTGQAVQASGVKGYFSDYLPASVAAKYNQNPALYNTIILGGGAAVLYMLLVPKKHREKHLEALTSAPSTVINLVVPKEAKEAVKEAALPAPTAAEVKSNPVLSLMGFANARGKRRKHRKSRRKA